MDALELNEVKGESLELIAQGDLASAISCLCWNLHRRIKLPIGAIGALLESIPDYASEDELSEWIREFHLEEV